MSGVSILSSEGQVVHDINILKYYQLASTIVLLLDYFLTLDLEIQNVWKRKFSLASALFFTNRYLPILIYIVSLYSNMELEGAGHFLCQTCGAWLLASNILFTVSQLAVALLVILRLYALYELRSWVLYLLGSFFALTFGLGTWASLALTVAQDLPFSGPHGCVLSVFPDKSSRFVFYWLSLVAFDFVIFLLTLVRGLRLLHTSPSLIHVFLRDGVIYFVGMLLAEVTNFVVFFNISPDLIAINWTYNSTITVVLLSRLVLNLREERRSGELSKSVGSGAASMSWSVATRRTSAMSSVLGSLGAPLMYNGGSAAGAVHGGIETIEEGDFVHDDDSKSFIDEKDV